MLLLLNRSTTVLHLGALLTEQELTACGFHMPFSKLLELKEQIVAGIPRDVVAAIVLSTCN